MAESKTETVTRADLSDGISSVVPSLSGKEAQRVVDNVIRGIRDSLVKGNEVKVSGFGKFVLQTKNPRKGRNPKTGEAITISGRRIMKFKASDVLRDSLNGNPFKEE
jgi:integration host factor subunit alpha